MGGLPGAERGDFHASGHIDGPGMEWLINTIDARRLLPVHTEQIGWFRDRWGERIIAPAYAERVELR